MAITLQALLKLGNFSQDSINKLMENIDYVSEDDKLKLSEKAWSNISERYNTQLALEKIHIFDEVKTGKRKYNPNDIEEVKTRLIHELVHKLEETESKESLEEVRKSLEKYQAK